MYFCQGGRDDLIQKALDKAGLLALLVFAWNPLNKFVQCLYTIEVTMHLQLLDRGNNI